VRSGFTVVELLITMGIIAILLAIMTPVLRYTIGYARGFRCQMALRNVAFDFQIFANDDFYGNRGDDAALPGDQFRMETFLEAEYEIDEFWGYGDAQTVPLETSVAFEMLQCPEVHGAVTLHAGASCTNGGVRPVAGASYGFNLNLHRHETVDRRGRPRLLPMFLRGPSLLAQDEGIPLALDVDARVAAERGVTPFFTAPDLSLPASRNGGRFWFPSMRHNGQANVSFIDGHVTATSDPIGEAPEFRWDFKPGQ